MRYLAMFFEKVFYYLSGEFIFEYYPNSGAIVLLRSLLISLFFFLLAIATYSSLDPDSTFEFDRETLFSLLHSKFEWFGALMGLVYVSLYARFSSQWQYLASLYNQLKEVQCREPLSSLNKGRYKQEQHRARVEWAHAFISDAKELHLASKGTFRTAILALLKNDEIRKAVRGESEEEVKEYRKFCKLINFDSRDN